MANGLNFLEGNVLKYISRYKFKNGLEDLIKAKVYLEKLIDSFREPEDTGVLGKGANRPTFDHDFSDRIRAAMETPTPRTPSLPGYTERIDR